MVNNLDPVTLRNPETPKGAPIIDYPVSEAVVKDDRYIVDSDTGEFKTTGETFEWTLKPGEELNFPSYVSKTLTARYHFLQLICPKCEKIFGFESTNNSYTTAFENYIQHDCNPVREVKQNDLPEANHNVHIVGFTCKICPFGTPGSTFKTNNNLAMHISSKHPKEFSEAFK